METLITQAILLAALTLNLNLLGTAGEEPAVSPVETTVMAEPAAGIEWLTWDEAAKKMETEPRKVMVDVYTDWCGWCKKMDASTMTDPKVIEEIQKNWYAVKLDGEEKEEIEFRGTVYKFVAQGRRGYHELPAALMNGRMSYPTLVFLDEEYNIIQPLPGYRQARELEMILSYFGDDIYKDTSWDDYQQSRNN